MAVKVKLDLSKLSDEFLYESNFIKNQQDIETELGFEELKNAIMSKIIVIEEKFV